MVGINLIVFIFFPAGICWGIRRREGAGALLEKEDVVAVKGVAACFVILGHLLRALGTSVVISPLLNSFTVLGGMGVLLFFFVSGYGLFKGYGHRKPSFMFWRKRIANMFLPFLMIQLFFGGVSMWQNKTSDLGKMLRSSLLDAWFIDVILIQYLLFFLAWIFSTGNRERHVFLCFIFSAALAAVFYFCGCNARWYNGLLLFPAGMLAAYKEQKIGMFLQDRWYGCVLITGVLFLVFGGIFTFFKGVPLWPDMAKTLSGISLCMFVCTLCRKVAIGSGIMRYIGERSLYFYLVHLSLMEMIGKIEKFSGGAAFYFVLFLSFVLVEIFYRAYGKWGWKIK